MAKVSTNKALVNAETTYVKELVRNAVAYNESNPTIDGKPYCSCYAALHKETLDQIEGMGLQVTRKKPTHTLFFLPKKGTKAYNALMEGSDVLQLAAAEREAKAAALKKLQEEKAEKAAAKAEKAKAAEMKAAERAKAAAERAQAAAEKAKAAAEKAAEKAAAKAEAAKAKAEKAETKTATAETKVAKAKAETKPTAPAAKKAEVKTAKAAAAKKKAAAPKKDAATESK